ncbi:sensor histidine kinase [Heyndrickxia acidicola]|uniref:histidine kinase n=1 Tax=Heyndrickxia acidicola TaxID=209389 RepID=A0ABU6MF08_9BACI|nr:ATP-binding protein [Heyndrickxia acidicola]MED1203019.1 ATP-binding protein [Heyndrickxia acidicola]
MTSGKTAKGRRYVFFQSLRLQLLSRSLFILAGLLLLIGLLQFMFMKHFLYQNKAMSLQSQFFSIPQMILMENILSSEENRPNHPMIFSPGVSMMYVSSDGSGKRILLTKNPQGDSIPALPKQDYMDVSHSNQKLIYKVVKDKQGQNQLIVLQPLRFQGNLQGVIQLSSDTGPLKDILTSQIIIYISLSCISLVLGLLTFLPVLRRTLIPLSNMGNKVEQINSGNLNIRVPAHQGQLEIDRLADSFNGMLERLQISFEGEKEAKEQMRRFIADASHELRTPLTSIHGFLEILLRGAVTRPEQLKKVLKTMLGESERVNKLVQNLLLLAKLDRIPAIEMEEGYLDELINEMESQLRLLAGERNVIFSIAPHVKMKMDRDKMKQVILNLYHNAVQHTNPEKGIIMITLKKESNGVVLEVEDNGSGISEEHLSHLFERFYRVDSSRSRKFGGAGLGLAITKSIIDIHKGTIHVESKIGEGTTFQIRLPQIDEN